MVDNWPLKFSTRVLRAARIILEYVGILHALCQRLDSRLSMANLRLISQSGIAVVRVRKGEAMRHKYESEGYWASAPVRG